MLAYYAPIIMTIFGGLIYHISSKNIPDLNPFLVLAVAYALQSIVCILLVPSFSSFGSFSLKLSDWNWWIIGLAAGSILLESGFILAYKAGWDLSNADMTSVAVVAIIFIPIGMIFYNEPITISRVIGICICLVGIYLMQ